MSRLALRTLMAAVGVSVLVFYAVVAGMAYVLLATLWANRPSLGTSLLIVGGLTVAFGFLSYQFGRSELLASVNAAEIARQDAPGLYTRVDEVAGRMSIDPPRLLVAEMALPNAMALGGRGNGVVAIDRSLFSLLSADELEAIVAHECAHLESRDSLVQALAYSATRTVVGFLSLALLPVLLFATGVERGLAWIRGRPARLTDGRVGWFRELVSSAVLLVLLVLTLLIRAHSRRREFAADDRAATVTGKPLALARALSKIDRVSDPNWSLLSPLYTRGDEEGALGRVFSTHPDTDERIERLVERARGRARA